MLRQCFPQGSYALLTFPKGNLVLPSPKKSCLLDIQIKPISFFLLSYYFWDIFVKGVCITAPAPPGLYKNAITFLSFSWWTKVSNSLGF